MTRSVHTAAREVNGLTSADSSCSHRPVSTFRDRTVAELVARLVTVAEDLARVTADVVVTLHTPAAPAVVEVVKDQPGPARTDWTVQECAELMGLNEQTVRELLRSGELRGYKVNREWRVSEEARREYVEERERITAAELGIAS